MKKSEVILGALELLTITILILVGMAWAETGSAKAGRWTIVLFAIALFGAAMLRGER